MCFFSGPVSPFLTVSRSGESPESDPGRTPLAWCVDDSSTSELESGSVSLLPSFSTYKNGDKLQPISPFQYLYLHVWGDARSPYRDVKDGRLHSADSQGH